MTTIKRQNIKINYKLQANIGVGTYGKVKLATDRVTKKLVAIKSMPIKDSTQ